MRKIQVLGTGCPKCQQLADNVEAAAKAAGVEYEIEKVTDINDIMSFGISFLSLRKTPPIRTGGLL